MTTPLLVATAATAAAAAAATATALLWAVRARRRCEPPGTPDAPNSTHSKPRLLATHETAFCADVQRLAHGREDALVVVRGEGAYLVDEAGREYLDARNNVALVGHQHPVWVAAVSRQLALTNTNARYLHPSRAAFADKLRERLPPHLDVLFLVNSGSEANDLALRLARAHTRRTRVVALHNGYHGFTLAALRASPYKLTPRAAVDGVPPQDDKDDGNETLLVLRTFAADAARRIRETSPPPACIIAEPQLSVGGVMFPPAGWLRDVFDVTRAVGGVAIADEIQVGFGRLGTHFWGFEREGAEPDIVTMGKGVGNGFPLGVVACRRSIADSLAREGRELFSTFGGNPVACEAGLAVLEVLEREKLQANALEVGSYMLRRLSSELVRDKVADVRGSGLFIGVEFLSADEAARVSRDMLRKHHILTSRDGPDDRVLVVKPPLCWTHADASRFCDALGECTRSLG